MKIKEDTWWLVASMLAFPMVLIIAITVAVKDQNEKIEQARKQGYEEGFNSGKSLIEKARDK